MRAVVVVLLAGALMCGHAAAQQQSTNAAAEINFDYSSPALKMDDRLFIKPPSEDTISGKHFSIRGPLVAPTKSKKLWEFPLKLLQMINPFRKPVDAEETSAAHDTDSMAWSTLMEAKGRSPFPDDTHHEAQLRLLTVTPGK